MTADLAYLMRTGLVAAALALGGCSADSTFRDINPKAEKPLSAEIVKVMQAKGMERSSPIMARIFKEEGKVEIWKQKKNGRYDVIATYDICKWSGKLGPKYIEGDRQAPEGFYTVRPAQMNPRSSYHLSFNIGYPNAYDRINGRTGSNLMVHGSCSSSGCYAVTDAQIEEIYGFGRDAFRGGQSEIQIQAFPFRMTAQNMARYKDDPNYKFWTMLKEGYDHFEITKVPPKVDVCEKRYVFNRIAPEGTTFDPAGACPATTQPDTLASAYSSYQSSYQAAFTTAAGASLAAPAASIAGLKEANLVSDWTKRRARGERISIVPPSMSHDGAVAVSSQMGRIDSPAGRRQAALDAAAAEKARAEAEKKRQAAQLAAAKEAEKIAKAQAAAAAANPPPPAAVAAAPAEPERAGVIGSVRKRFTGLFGG